MKFLNRALLLKALVALYLLLALCGAQAEITIGAEFEFVDPNVSVVIAPGLKGHEKAMSQRLVQGLRAKCKVGCREKQVPGKWSTESRFYLPSGFWIEISWDPNVVEIKTQPLPLSEFKKIADELQEFLFDTAAEVGLVTDTIYRAGHFNFGTYSAFKGQADEMLKFVVDFANRPELALGIWRSPNMLNAPPLAALKKDQRSNLAKISRGFLNKKLNTIDLGLHENGPNYYWAPVPSQLNIREVTQLLLDSVFNSTYHERLNRFAPHYQALSIRKLVKARSVTDDQPTEIRSVRSQKSVDEFVLLAELIQGRLLYLHNLPDEKAFLVSETARTTFSSQTLVDRFFIYVSEANLEWNKFKVLLPSELISKNVSPFLTGIHSAWKKSESIDNLIELLDLLPVSPWFVNQLSLILQDASMPQKDRLKIDKHLVQLSTDSSFSTEARRTFSTFRSTFFDPSHSQRCQQILEAP